jgi:hypothetical protein
MSLTEAFRQIEEENALLIEPIFIESLDFDLEP